MDYGQNYAYPETNWISERNFVWNIIILILYDYIFPLRSVPVQ